MQREWAVVLKLMIEEGAPVGRCELMLKHFEW
jgi:hypothetical protein